MKETKRKNLDKSSSLSLVSFSDLLLFADGSSYVLHQIYTIYRIFVDLAEVFTQIHKRFLTLYLSKVLVTLVLFI